MPIINRLAEFQQDIVALRHDLHRHPELLYEVHRTAATVAGLLRDFGVDAIETGIGRTGVVGVIKGAKGEGRVIGLRADMDALPILETTGKDYASTEPGKMHACGHDGHTAMLLGAARYLAETRNFRRHGCRDLPAGGGRRRRRPRDGRGRADGALRHRRGLWAAQHARPRYRAFRHSPRPDHGRDRRVLDRDHRPWRPCREAACHHRPDRHRRAARHGPCRPSSRAASTRSNPSSCR